MNTISLRLIAAASIDNGRFSDLPLRRQPYRTYLRENLSFRGRPARGPLQEIQLQNLELWLKNADASAE